MHGRRFERKHIRSTLLCLLLCAPGPLLRAQGPLQEAPPASAAQEAQRPLDDTRKLLLEVEANQKRLEALERDYTYHVRTETQDLDKNGNVKKNAVIDAESLTLDGVRVNRVTARNGQALTPDEQRKEDERIDKLVKQRRERRDKLQDKGTETDASGNAVLPASRILELGTFSNPRREMLNGRPSIVVDYAGDPHAKTRSAFEGVVRNLVGTVWIDAADRVLVRGEGQFRDDFKIGGGLVANVHKGTHFDFRTARQADGVWLLSTVNAGGSARFLLVEGFNGRVHIATSDYRRFRASATISSEARVLRPEGQPDAPAAGAKPEPPARPSGLEPTRPPM